MTTQLYALGIDPGKTNLEAALIDAKEEVLVQPTGFSQDAKGFEELLAMVRSRLMPGDQLVVGIEASGACDDNLLAWFSSLKHEAFEHRVFRLDPGQVHGFRTQKPQRGKTDPIDAIKAGCFSMRYADKLHRFIHDPKMQGYRLMATEHIRLTHDRTRLINRLHDLLVVVFPEFGRLFEDSLCPTALSLLAVAPTPSQVKKLGVKRLAKIRTSKRAPTVGIQRASKLLELAKTSVSSADSQQAGSIVQSLVEQIQMLDHRLEQIDQQMSALADEAYGQSLSQGMSAEANSTPNIGQQIVLVDSLPGVSKVGAAIVVLRSSDISRFTSADAYAAQMATCPEQMKTGTSMNYGRLSNRGDRHSRPFLYMLAHNMIQRDQAMHFHYWRHMQSGKTHKQAVCACMHRMSKLIFTLVKTQRLYDPQRALDNVCKHHPEQWAAYQAHKANPQRAKSKRGTNQPSGPSKLPLRSKGASAKPAPKASPATGQGCEQVSKSVIMVVEKQPKDEPIWGEKP